MCMGLLFEAGTDNRTPGHAVEKGSRVRLLDAGAGVG